ncbi:MAG: bifunctional phosphopantothenoylcysteine decarboxylase/phosphopantothenate--cysteine ligase CoaBC [bacterium]
MTLEGKKVLLGITGGIAAYKSLTLLRLLVAQGAEVKVVMTASACRDFIAPGSFQALSGHPVALDVSGGQDAMEHISLARWCDLMMIAPATANTLNSMAQGLAGNLLLNLYLACQAPVAVAPAMNQAMWEHPATQRSISQLRHDGVRIFGPAKGAQACGEQGFGRVVEPEELFQFIQHTLLHPLQDLTGVKILISAGPSYEDLDPVRYIGNRSSGKMGYALAWAAQARGAQVCLVSGPVSIQSTQLPIVKVRSAQQMHDAVLDNLVGQDVYIGAAAVADYRPVIKETHKIKKDKGRSSIEITQNADIISKIGQNRPDGLFLVGFAAETDHVDDYAKKKLREKNLHMIAANQVGQKGYGFDADKNKIKIFTQQSDQQTICLDADNKSVLANQLLDAIIKFRGT